ncbi:MAG: hypothetical protein QME45_12425 [Clostridiales bacterium]|nr:hypothetical protein [Clostridiales bacterium]
MDTTLSFQNVGNVTPRANVCTCTCDRFGECTCDCRQTNEIGVSQDGRSNQTFIMG